MNVLESLLSNGNLKIGKDTLIFNMNPARYCPSDKLGLCKHSDICYAKKAEKMYKQVLPYRIRQSKYWNNCTAEKFVSDLVNVINSKKTKIKYLRVSKSGDFNSQSDVNKLSDISDLLKGIIKVYTYTARKDLNFDNISDNLTVNGSGFMVSNQFEVTTNKSTVNCPANCRICNKCKFSTGKIIYALKH